MDGQPECTYLKPKGFSQVQSSLVRRELMDGAPQVQHVAGGLARRIEALKDVLAEVHKYTGNSAKAWYLLAEATDLPVIETAFLNGQESPTIELVDQAQQHAVTQPIVPYIARGK